MEKVTEAKEKEIMTRGQKVMEVMEVMEERRSLLED